MSDRVPSSPDSRDRAAPALREARIEQLMHETLDAEAAGDVRRSRELRREGETLATDFGQRVTDSRQMLSELSLLPNAPDLTASILADAELQRPFFPRQTRHRRSHVRTGMGVACVGLIALAAALQRFAPGLGPFGDSQGPVGGLVEASSADLSTSLASLQDAVSMFKSDVAAPMDEVFSRSDGRVAIAFELIEPAAGVSGFAPTRMAASTPKTAPTRLTLSGADRYERSSKGLLSTMQPLTSGADVLVSTWEGSTFAHAGTASTRAVTPDELCRWLPRPVGLTVTPLAGIVTPRASREISNTLGLPRSNASVIPLKPEWVAEDLLELVPRVE